jgi:hypothetical protein
MKFWSQKRKAEIFYSLEKLKEASKIGKVEMYCQKIANLALCMFPSQKIRM